VSQVCVTIVARPAASSSFFLGSLARASIPRTVGVDRYNIAFWLSFLRVVGLFIGVFLEDRSVHNVIKNVLMSIYLPSCHPALLLTEPSR
jgi:hypothetical protein